MACIAQLVDDVVVNKFELDKGSISIGRHPDNDIIIDDISVSGHHAILDIKNCKYMDGLLEFYLTDCGSKNGTFVNEISVKEKTVLKSGDVIRIAWNKFKLLDDSDSMMASTAHLLQ